jgi:regulator of protease activity HflC (stomatin/prohibitin superfamily)
LGEDGARPRRLAAARPRKAGEPHMAQLSMPRLPSPGSASRGGLFSMVGLLALIGALFLLYLVSPFFTVGEYERTVVTRFGQFSSVAGPGLHFRIPSINGLETYPIGIQRLQKDHLNTCTVDNQELDALVTLNFRINENEVRRVFTNNRDYRANLESFMIDRFKREMGKINITQVAAHRGDVAVAGQKALTTDAMDLFGITIVDFQINDIRYTEQYRRAVDAAAIAKAKVEQAEHERRQAEVVAQRQKIQAEGEANAVREQARGKPDGELLLATAQAKGKELVGLAEAKALEAQGQVLRSNASLIQLEVAKRWSGNLPVNMYGSAPLPFLNLPAESQQAIPR